MNKKAFFGMIIGLCLLNIKLSFDMADLKNQINNINFSIQDLNHSVNSISSNVSNTVNKIYEDKKLVYNLEYDVINLSKDLKEVKIDFKWSLHELSKDYKVYLLYGALEEETQNVSKWNEVKAEDLGNLNYACTLTMPYLNNYQFKVVAKNDSNTISEKLTDIYFLDKFNKRVSISAMPNTKSFSKSHVNLKFNVDITNMYDLSFEKDISGIDESMLKMKNVTVKVYSNNNLKKEIKILQNGVLKNENASNGRPNRIPESSKVEQIYYEGNLEYDTDSNESSRERIEVIVEDYMGKIYKNENAEI